MPKPAAPVFQTEIATPAAAGHPPAAPKPKAPICLPASGSAVGIAAADLPPGPPPAVHAQQDGRPALIDRLAFPVPAPPADHDARARANSARAKAEAWSGYQPARRRSQERRRQWNSWSDTGDNGDSRRMSSLPEGVVPVTDDPAWARRTMAYNAGRYRQHAAS